MNNKLFETFRRVIKHELVKGSIWLMLGTIGSSTFGFLTNIFLLRKLTISDYGIYASLISFLTLAVIPASSITTVLTRFAGVFTIDTKDVRASFFYRRMITVFIILSFLVFMVLLMFLKVLSAFLNIENNIFVLLIFVPISLSYMGIINQSYLFGLLKFHFIGVMNTLTAAIKLIFIIILIYLGFGLLGVMWSIVISSISTFVIRIFKLKSFLKVTYDKSKIKLPIKDMAKYAAPSFLALLSISSFTSVDVILARHFLPAKEAGLYGGLSLFGKIIMYLAGPVTSVMFPTIVRRYEKKEGFIRVFYLALLLVLIPSVIITVFYFIFPDFIITFIIKKITYFGVANLLGVFGIFGLIYSILYLFHSFFLSIKKTNIVYFTLFFVILQITLIYIFHSTIIQIISASIISATLLLVTLVGIFYYKVYRTLKVV